MEPLYSQVINYLKYLISENKLNKSFRIPSEAQLQQKCNVSRVTVRRALRELQEENLIYSLKGKGYYIKENIFNEDNYALKTTIAFIMTTPVNVLYNQILKGVNDYCNQHDIHLVVYFTYNNSSLEKQKIQDASRLHVNGIILLPCDSDIYSAELLKYINKKPIVLVDRTLYGLNLPTVSSNHAELATFAVKYLLKKGANDIVYIVHQTSLSSSTIERQESIKNAILKYTGSLNNSNFLHEDSQNNNLYEVYLQYFSQHPNTRGVIASPCNNQLFDALKKLNKTINKDIFLASIDNDPFTPTSIVVPSIIQNGHKIGFTAAEHIYKMIHENLPNTKQTIHIPVKYKNWK